MSVSKLNDKGATLIEDQRYDITRGKVNGVGYVRKFGKNPAPANGVLETIWDGSTAGHYPFPTEAVASGVIVTSSSVFDEPADGAGTLAGARAVTVYGLLSGTWALDSEVIAMSGTGVKNFIRIYRAHANEVGVSGTNVGNISVKMNTVEVAKIIANNGQTLMAVYTIPSGVTGYIDSWRGGVNADNATTAKFGQFDLMISSGVGAGSLSRRVRDTMTLKDADVTKDLPYPIVVPEMHDVMVDFTAGGATTIATGGFNIRLENNS